MKAGILTVFGLVAVVLSNIFMSAADDMRHEELKKEIKDELKEELTTKNDEEV